MTDFAWKERTGLLLNNVALKKLQDSHVLLVGLGGVGGYVLEALVRVGVGAFTLVDGDCFAPSNLNRQILATISTVGKPKTAVAKARAEEINPDVSVTAVQRYLTPQNLADLDFDKFDCIIDAVDDVSVKVELACVAQQKDKKILSCMGTGNKLLPFFKVGDVYKTTNCPLARVMRKKLKERGVKKLTVVYSEELPVKNTESTTDNGCLAEDCREPSKNTQNKTVGSVSYVPAAAGLVVAYKAIDLLIN